MYSFNHPLRSNNKHITVEKEKNKEKSYLEEKIEEKAQKLLEKEWREFINYCSKHPIGKRLEIEGHRVFAGQSSGQCGDDIFSWWYPNQYTDKARELSNSYEILAKRKQEIIEEETDKLLKKMKELEYLF